MAGPGRLPGRMFALALCIAVAALPSPASSASLSGQLVFGTNAGKVHKVIVNEQSQTQEIAWTYDGGNGLPVRSSPAVDVARSRVYVGTDAGALECLDLATGRQIWNYTVGKAVRSGPLLHGGSVFFGSLDDNAYAVDAATGKLVWARGLGGAVDADPAVAGPYRDSATNRMRYVVYFGSSNGRFYATYADGPGAGTTAGVPAWAAPIDTGDAISGGAAVFAGGPAGVETVFFGNDGTDVHALRGDTGAAVFTAFNTAGQIVATPLLYVRYQQVNGTDGKVRTVNTTMLFVGTLNGNFYAVDARAGTKLWGPVVVGGAVKGRAAVVPPAIGPSRNGTVVVASAGTPTGSLLAMDINTMRPQWSHTLDSDGTGTDVVLINDAACVGTDAGSIRCVDVRTGVLRWQYRAAEGKAARVLSTPFWIPGLPSSGTVIHPLAQGLANDLGDAGAVGGTLTILFVFVPWCVVIWANMQASRVPLGDALSKEPARFHPARLVALALVQGFICLFFTVYAAGTALFGFLFAALGHYAGHYRDAKVTMLYLGTSPLWFLFMVLDFAGLAADHATCSDIDDSMCRTNNACGWCSYVGWLIFLSVVHIFHSLAVGYASYTAWKYFEAEAGNTTRQQTLGSLPRTMTANVRMALRGQSAAANKGAAAAAAANGATSTVNPVLAAPGAAASPVPGPVPVARAAAPPPVARQGAPPAPTRAPPPPPPANRNIV